MTVLPQQLRAAPGTRARAASATSTTAAMAPRRLRVRAEATISGKDSIRETASRRGTSRWRHHHALSGRPHRAGPLGTARASEIRPAPLR